MFNPTRDKRSRLLALAILLLALTAAAAGAAEFRFVTLDGSDLNSGLRPETPWRTLTWAALNSPPGTTILVGAGEYREDTGGFGSLYIAADQVDLRFEAQGEVVLKAALPDIRVLHLAAEGPIAFAGFSFAGVDSCDYGVTGLPMNCRFESCRFSGSLIGALKMENGQDCVLDDCDFGTPETPLLSRGVRLIDSISPRIRNSRFHVTGAACLQLERCHWAELLDNQFGEPGAALDLDSNWALRSVDCDPVLVQGNDIVLSNGHGIGLPLASRDLLNLTVRDNSVLHEASTVQHGLMIGATQPGAGSCRYPLIEGNHVEGPVESGARSNLFVGNVHAPQLIGNTTVGGGYGITLRSCDDARMEGNNISAAWRAGIMDQGGIGCEFYDNEITAGEGRCARLTNDGDRQLDGSHWHHNTLLTDRVVYELSSPVNPVDNDVACDWNRYRLGDHDQDFAVALGAVVDFFEAAEDWDWERHGEVEVDDASPLVLTESWQPSAYQARLELELTESAQGWLAFGPSSPTDTLFGEVTSMRQQFHLDGLEPWTVYRYAYGFCDLEGRCLTGSGEFATEHETAAPPPAPSALRLDAPWPNPANPSSRIRFELERAGEVCLSLHDLAGRRLRLLAEGPWAAGGHELRIDGLDDRGVPLSSGVYLIRLESGGRALSRKWQLIK
jgi:hypothetical protein